jgi:hypothetical protein
MRDDYWGKVRDNDSGKVHDNERGALRARRLASCEREEEGACEDTGAGFRRIMRAGLLSAVQAPVQHEGSAYGAERAGGGRLQAGSHINSPNAHAAARWGGCMFVSNFDGCGPVRGSTWFLNFNLMVWARVKGSGMNVAVGAGERCRGGALTQHGSLEFFSILRAYSNYVCARGLTAQILQGTYPPRAVPDELKASRRQVVPS